MKVTNCPQNTLPKQSFGMKILFHPEDVEKGIIPNVERMVEVLTKVNADKEVSELVPDEVRLHYKGKESLECLDDSLQPFQKILHRWHLKFQDFKPKEVQIFESSTVSSMISRIARKAQDFAESIVEQQEQRVADATKIAADAQKIKDAGLV